MTQTPPPSKRPDRTEVSVKFGCGALMGLFLAVSLALSWGATTLGGLMMMGLVSAMICGLLAVRYGERFWRFMISLLRYW